MSKRLSLTLEREDEIAVEPFTHAGTPEREALAAVLATGPGSGKTVTALLAVEGLSDAAILRALIRVGADTIRDRLLADGYAALAEEWAEHDDERRALRARQRHSRAERDAGAD